MPDEAGGGGAGDSGCDSPEVEDQRERRDRQQQAGERDCVEGDETTRVQSGGGWRRTGISVAAAEQMAAGNRTENGRETGRGGAEGDPPNCDRADRDAGAVIGEPGGADSAVCLWNR